MQLSVDKLVVGASFFLRIVRGRNMHLGYRTQAPLSEMPHGHLLCRSGRTKSDLYQAELHSQLPCLLFRAEPRLLCGTIPKPLFPSPDPEEICQEPSLLEALPSWREFLVAEEE